MHPSVYRENYLIIWRQLALGSYGPWRRGQWGFLRNLDYRASLEHAGWAGGGGRLRDQLVTKR